MDYLWDPERSVEDQYGPSLIQQNALEDNSCEADNVEDDVKDGQTLPQVLLVKHLSLVELSAPHQDKESWLKCEAADKIPEGWQSQVLHELTLALNRKLEVDGEENKVPDEVDPNGHWRYTWS